MMNTNTNGNELAFPFVETREMQGESISFGLTKREHFAAMAMQGYRASLHYAEIDAKEIASLACDDADALLRALAAGVRGEMFTPPKVGVELDC
jgi:hypothetical protein